MTTQETPTNESVEASDHAVVMPELMRVSASEFRFVTDGQEYRWEGGFGSLLSSIEGDIKQGTPRVIGNVHFYAWRVDNRGWFKAPRVHWSPVHDFNADQIREFRRAVFSA